MRIYSNDVVTRSDLDEIDALQTKDIKQLRRLIFGAFAVNLLVSITALFISILGVSD